MIEYEVNDKIVLKNDNVNEIGVITNVRRHKNAVIGYDIRSEKGSGYVLVQVDANLTTRQRNRRTNYPVIDSKLTTAWIGSDSETNLFAKENVGHTRANFPKGYPLYFDGENGGGMHQFEKHNDLIFPTQGPRSF